MKIDRLLAITIYLLNHGKCSAQKLSEHFEVSTRTIMRDMDTLCMARIPIVSTMGVDGGYEINERFVMKNQLSNEVDYSYIVTALKGLITAFPNKDIEAVFEKMNNLNSSADNNVSLDLSLAREKETINDLLYLLSIIIKKKHAVEFKYTNANGECKTVEAEPVYVVYKWYNWYLVSYDKKSKHYKMYKLIRMSDLRMLDVKNTIDHDINNVRKQLEESKDKRKMYHIKLHCKDCIRSKCKEYLNGRITKEYENKDFDYEIIVPENEQFWYGVLLSFGNNALVLEPEELKNKIYEDCQKIMKLYIS